MNHENIYKNEFIYSHDTAHKKGRYVSKFTRGFLVTRKYAQFDTLLTFRWNSVSDYCAALLLRGLNPITSLYGQMLFDTSFGIPNQLVNPIQPTAFL